MIRLTDVMYDVFNSSKRWYRLSLGAAVATYALAVLSVFNLPPGWLNVVAIAAIASQLGAFAFRLQAEKLYEVGEQVRRLNLRCDGLGHRISQVEVAKVLNTVGKTQFSTAPSSIDYFESSSNPSPKRLIENLRETAFWTSALAKKTHSVFWYSSLSGFAVGIIALIVVAIAGFNQNDVALFAKAIIPGITFWSAGDLMVCALKYSKLSRDADAVCDKADSALMTQHQLPTEAESLILMDEYNCALAGSLPIPDWIYHRNRNLLNDLWNKRGAVSP